ncbi:cytochrome c oxidase subunit 1 [Chytridiales sp. JEL 0842]|nr:cytochrome c oxidase subunit 1 [Chytridiales sp. JEL 0842]
MLNGNSEENNNNPWEVMLVGQKVETLTKPSSRQTQHSTQRFESSLPSEFPQLQTQDTTIPQQQHTEPGLVGNGPSEMVLSDEEDIIAEEEEEYEPHMDSTTTSAIGNDQKEENPLNFSDSNPFQSFDDVDNLLKRYQKYWKNKALQLKNEPPLPDTPPAPLSVSAQTPTNENHEHEGVSLDDSTGLMGEERRSEAVQQQSQLDASQMDVDAVHVHDPSPNVDFNSSTFPTNDELIQNSSTEDVKISTKAAAQSIQEPLISFHQHPQEEGQQHSSSLPSKYDNEEENSPPDLQPTTTNNNSELSWFHHQPPPNIDMSTRRSKKLESLQPRFPIMYIKDPAVVSRETIQRSEESIESLESTDSLSFIRRNMVITSLKALSNNKKRKISQTEPTLPSKAENNNSNMNIFAIPTSTSGVLKPSTPSSLLCVEGILDLDAWNTATFDSAKVGGSYHPPSYFDSLGATPRRPRSAATNVTEAEHIPKTQHDSVTQPQELAIHMQPQPLESILSQMERRQRPRWVPATNRIKISMNFSPENIKESTNDEKPSVSVAQDVLEDFDNPDLMSGLDILEKKESLLVSGKTLQITPVILAGGSASLGMGWTPAPARLAVPVRVFNHTASFAEGLTPQMQHAQHGENKTLIPQPTLIEDNNEHEEGDNDLTYSDMQASLQTNANTNSMQGIRSPSSQPPPERPESSAADVLVDEAETWVHPGNLYAHSFPPLTEPESKTAAETMQEHVELQHLAEQQHEDVKTGAGEAYEILDDSIILEEPGEPEAVPDRQEEADGEEEVPRGRHLKRGFRAKGGVSTNLTALESLLGHKPVKLPRRASSSTGPTYSLVGKAVSLARKKSSVRARSTSVRVLHSKPMSTFDTEKADKSAESDAETESQQAITSDAVPDQVPNETSTKTRGNTALSSSTTPLPVSAPATASAALPPATNEDPISFYVKRLKSAQSLSGTIDSIADTTPNTRPVSAHSTGFHRSYSGSYSSMMSGIAGGRSSVTLPESKNGRAGEDASSHIPNNLEPVGPSLFEIVHDLAKRQQILTPAERARYATLNDAGAPEELAAIEGESALEPLAEIEKLSAMISSSSLPIPAFLRRRGILFGRVGKFEESMADLSKAIHFDPFNSDALWNRHQLYLRQGNAEQALKDLDAITDSNKQHLGAFLAKARIYQELSNEERTTGLPLDPATLNNIKLAVVNYSQVIRLKPEEPEGYYQRACLFEAENEMVYANEDFKMVRQLDPLNEHAIYNLAVYSFQRQLWDDAIQAFTKLIKLNPLNGQAYLYRGRAHAFLAQWDESLRDLTMAIQLAPDRAEVFFHRGCLLSERNRRKAIEDLSISVLIDDGPNNTEAFYQRAVLYYKLKKYDLAVIDYTTVVELDHTKSVAWLNLGIIYMRFFSEYYKALDCLNKAIQYDPIQVRAYLCRGDLYQILHSDSFSEIAESDKRTRKPKGSVAMSFVDKAIRDYSRAIHMCPSDYLLYLYRGRLLLKQGRMKLATYDFHSAFELNSAIAQTFVQRVLVLSFQRKYEQIISEFDERSRIESIDDPDLYMLIAKARVKCNDNEGAIRDLSKAIEYNRKEPQIYLQRGICYENLKDWTNAAAEFTKCIALNPNYSKAYYHRGLCKLHEGNSRGVVDLDRALKLDGKFFEAYLTRASYYHTKGSYAEGIEDCNEALRLEPTSIRAHLLRGACKCKLHQYGLAILDFTKAIHLDKTSHFAFYNRAVTYQLLEDYENAIKDYSIVLLIHNDSNAYRNRGLIYWKQGDAENALLDLFAARDNFPGDARLHGLLALCLQKVGRTEESLAAFTSAIRVNQNLIEAYLGRGNVYASINDTKAARSDYARVIHMYPTCTEAYVNMAYTMQAEGRYKKAWELFTMAIAINPLCTSALEGRSIVHYIMRNYFGALIDICKAIELHPDNAEYLTNRGVIYQALNDPIAALQSYKLAIQKDKKYPLAYFNAANLYFSQQRWEQALEYFERALRLDPEDFSAILNRGITKSMLGDTTGALEDFNLSILLNPTSPEVYFNRANLFQKMGNFDEADKDYSAVLTLSPADNVTYLERGLTRGKQSRLMDAMGDFARFILFEPESA